MASRRISNIEVAGIATVVLSVAAVLTVVLLSAWLTRAAQDEQIAGA
jgi:hypothetical protein